MSTTHRLAARLLLLFSCLFVTIGGSTAIAQRAHHKLLVINSYDEEEPWGNKIAAEISMYLASIDTVSGDIVNLDNALISDSVTFKTMADHVFARYADNHPSYVIMLGNFAFSLRDRIKEEWGDVPMLLISRITTFSPQGENFCNNTQPVSHEQGIPLESVRDQYNFTTLYLADHYKECVDLMVNVIPDMEELVFLSTRIYVSRRVAYEIEGYIKEAYPNIRFKWLQASQESASEFQQYIIQKHPRSGLLMTSWVYEKTGARGFQTLTSNDLRLMSSSKTPIFAFREAYMPLGCIGGVYVNNDNAMQQMRDIIHKMLEGKSMRDIDFVYCRDKETKINYRLLQEHNLDESRCPDNTIFINKAPNYWERYKWQTIISVILILIIVISLWLRLHLKSKALERLRYNDLFLNNMPVPYAKASIHYDNKGNVQTIAYTKTNNAFAELIAENANPANPFLLFPASFIAEKTSELLHDHSVVRFVYHFEKTDTWYAFILCTVMKNKRESGTLNIIDVFASNITNNMKLEAQLRATARKLNLALSVSRTVPWQWNLKTDVVQFDDQEILGRTRSYSVKTVDGHSEWNILYDDFMQRIHPEDRPALLKLRKDFASGTIENFNMQLRMFMHLHSDEVEWIEISSALTESDTDGTSKIVTGTLRIITEQKHQEEDLILAKQRAEESDRMKSAFLANMSHEIRTPLNAIVGFSNLISEAADDAERADFISTINHNSDLLLSLINDVLDLAKIESNTIDLHYTVSDINAIMQSAEQSIRLRVPEGVQLNMALGSQQCICETDPVRLSQVLINLLTNACKFTTHGYITMGYKVQNDSLYCYVEDTGIGISPEGCKRIFERFVKLNSFTQGTGLGLSICRRLVELMGGEIGVESQGTGCGSRFWFTLPYVPTNIEEEQRPTALPEANTKTDNVEDSGLPYILVAEDHDSNYKLLDHLLKNQYNILHALNGKEAVEMCRQYNPYMVLMDINMPEMNGYEAVEQIRASGSNVPIIAVTAYAYASDRMRILNSGFNAYVAKPVSRKTLKEAFEKALITPPHIKRS